MLYFNTANLEINVNDIVIVETEDGERLARITFTPDQLLLIQTREFTGSVLRLATEEDFNEGSSDPGLRHPYPGTNFRHSPRTFR